MNGKFKDTSGQAFPAGTDKLYDEEDNMIPCGMTMRDYFAGQALMSLPYVCAHDTLLKGMTFEKHVARNAYMMADAMLAERKGNAS